MNTTNVPFDFKVTTSSTNYWTITATTTATFDEDDPLETMRLDFQKLSDKFFDL